MDFVSSVLFIVRPSRGRFTWSPEHSDIINSETRTVELKTTTKKKKKKKKKSVELQAGGKRQDGVCQQRQQRQPLRPR
ncbi:unnamed protein product [Arctogadus glacialis]